MTAVPIQPRATIDWLDVNAPITDFLDAIRIITTIKGTATTPLITALQNSAFIGLIGEYWMTSADEHADRDHAIEAAARRSAFVQGPHFQPMASESA